MKSVLLSIVLIAASLGVASGQTTGEEILDSWEQRESMSEKSLLNNYPATNIGPVVQGGRITDIVVNPNNKHEFYVGFASGGVFRTRNNGVSFEPVFDLQGALGVGDMALAPSDESILYVGTGEKNSSRSSYAGSGIYRTSDKGRSWEYLGLPGIQHTGRVIVHPENPDIVWVAAMGALYSNNSERGVYKTTNGGQTWRKTLHINDSTGIVDLLINPEDPDHLWAAAWERDRKAWNFKESGSGSGIYISEDGGENWTRSTAGLPQGSHVGRIGIDLCREEPNVLYALIDNQFEEKEQAEREEGKLYPEAFVDMSLDDFSDLEDEKLEEFLRENRFPEKYDAARVRDEVSQGLYEVSALADYLGDANEALFNTRVTGAELYRSDDYGKTWEKTHTELLEGVYFTYGYYFGEVRVDPADPDKVYIFGVPLLKTTDGGEAFHRIDTMGNVHVDHQALWIDPDNPRHLLLGNDGGLYLSYDEGAEWLHLNNMPVGQFYTVNVDMEKPYNVYGGLQDNGVRMGSSRSVPNRTRFWESVGGGDGMYVIPDPRDHMILYTGLQFGNYVRRNRRTGGYTRITPQHDIGEPRLRWNWRTPLIMSPHNPDILYMGAQVLFRSLDQGDNWERISDDLTRDLPQGDVPFSTITSISESPLRFGLIAVGTDDGKTWISRSGGGVWTEISDGLPRNKWVSSIVMSAHQEGRIYVSLNGYREDDFSTYIFRSNDFGQTWENLQADMPEIVVNVIYEDPVNPELIYVGTDHGTYVSLDGCASWEMLNSVPNVASYDMVVHPRENELIVGTHGRSIYRVDVKPLQKLAGHAGIDVAVFEVPDIRRSDYWGGRRYAWQEIYEPSRVIEYWIGEDKGIATLEVFNAEEVLIRRMEIPGSVGYHRVSWDLKQHSYEKRRKKDPEPVPVYVDKGVYRVVITSEESSDETSFEVK